MKELRLTSDTPSWTFISEIQKELKTFEKILIEKYQDLPFEFCIVFRCLSPDFNWKSKRQFSKKENILYVEIIMFDPEFEKIKSDKDAQRKIMGKHFYEYFKETLEKYHKKIPALDLYKDELLLDTENWLTVNHWIGDSTLKSDFSIQEITQQFVEIKKICNKDIFDPICLDKITVVKIKEFRNILELYLLDQPNDVGALKIMSVIECYLLNFKSAYLNLEKAVLLKSDYKDKNKLVKLLGMIE